MSHVNETTLIHFYRTSQYGSIPESPPPPCLRGLERIPLGRKIRGFPLCLLLSKTGLKNSPSVSSAAQNFKTKREKRCYWDRFRGIVQGCWGEYWNPWLLCSWCTEERLTLPPLLFPDSAWQCSKCMHWTQSKGPLFRAAQGNALERKKDKETLENITSLLSETSSKDLKQQQSLNTISQSIKHHWCRWDL